MEKFDPIDIEFLINSEEAKADAAQVRLAIQQIGDQAGLSEAEIAEFLRRLDEAATKPLPVPDAAPVDKLKSSYNGLGNSINQITRELPAFTFSAQTGFLALSNNIPILADEIGRLSAQNKALQASGQATVPVFKRILSSVFSFNTLLSVGVTLLTVYGGKIFDFISQLTGAQSSIDKTEASLKSLNEAFDSSDYKSVIQNIIDVKAALDASEGSVKRQEEAVNLYNEKLGDNLGKVESVTAAEDILTAKAPAFIRATLLKAAAQITAAEAATKLAEKFKEQSEAERSAAAQEARVNTSTGREKRSAQLAANRLNIDVDEIKKEADEIASDYEDVLSNFKKDIDDLEAQFAFDVDPDDPEPDGDLPRRDLNARKELLEKVADLDREFARKQLDRDEEEIQALRDKFSKVRALIDAFNTDPKNAQVKIDATDLDDIEQGAIADVTFKQDTRALSENLAEQKALFEEFEDFKTTFGVDKARERYAEQLGEFESYAALLKASIADNEESFTAVAAGDATGGQAARVRLLEQERREEKARQQQQYDELLAGLITYQERRNLIIEQYQAQREQLQANGDFAAIDELSNQQQEALDKLDDQFAKSTDAYKALIGGVEGLSKAAAKGVIDNAQRMLDALVTAGQISDELAKEIQAKIDNLSQDLEEDESAFAKQANNFAAKSQIIAGAFFQLANSLESYDEGLADTVQTLGELTQVASDAAGAAADFSNGKIVEGIAKTISAISGVLTIGARARESERQAKAELLKINQRIEDGERRLNQILRDRNILQAQNVELTLEGIRAQREALALAQQQNAAEAAALLQELQGEQFIASSSTEEFGGFLGIGTKTRVANEYAELLGLTFEEIEALFEQGQLEGRAAELFEQLRTLREEGEDINQLLSDLEEQSNQIFTGTTSEAIADSIIEGLRQGKDSFDEFAGDIERLLQNAILNAIRYNLLEEPLQALYEQFAAFAESDGELTDAEAQAIRDAYEAQVQAAIDQYEQLNDILDQDLLNDGGETGLQGAIRRELTEETASELTGLFRGQFDITRRHFELHELHYAVAQQCCMNIYGILQHSAQISINTAATALNTGLMLQALEAISNNIEIVNLNSPTDGPANIFFDPTRDLGL